MTAIEFYPFLYSLSASTARAAGSGVQAYWLGRSLPKRYCRGHESERQSRPELKIRRATQCVKREYSWLLAALAQSRLAHSCPPRRSKSVSAGYIENLS